MLYFESVVANQQKSVCLKIALFQPQDDVLRLAVFGEIGIVLAIVHCVCVKYLKKFNFSLFGQAFAWI